jgi:hypothetical protein
MKNVTVTMDEEVARWARVEAARQEMSLARFVGKLVREHMQERQTYERAMRAFMRTKPTGGGGGQPLPTRDEIHDRTALRRQ